MKEKQIGIVVLNYKGVANTLECVESLKKINTSGYSYKIVIVENNSQDGSAEELSQLKDIELVINQENLGFSGGMNVGIKYCVNRNFDGIVIINNDTYVDANFLNALINASDVPGIVSPKIYFAPGYEFHKNRYTQKDLGKVIWYGGGEIDWSNIIGVHLGVDEVDKGQFKKHEISFATGCCMYISTSVIKKIGYFDEKYFLYLEDMDFCVRAQKAGYKIIFEPRAIIWHKNAAAAGGSGSKLQEYYFTRNRLIFGFKYAKLKTKIALLKHIITRSKDPVVRKALIDFLTFKYGKQF